MGNNCVCSKSKEALLQEELNKEELRKWERLKEQKIKIISKWMKYWINRKRRLSIQSYLTCKVNKLIFPSDGREKYRNKKFFEKQLEECLDTFQSKYPLDKFEYKDFILHTGELKHAFEIVKVNFIKKIKVENVDFYNKYSKEAPRYPLNGSLKNNPKSPTNNPNSILSPNRKFQRKKTKRSTLKKTKGLLNIRHSIRKSDPDGETQKTVQIEEPGSNTRLKVELDAIFNIVSVQNSKRDSLKEENYEFFKLLFTKDPFHDIKLPSFMISLVKYFYSLFFYKSSGWISSTEGIQKFFKKDIKKALAAGLKDNEGHTLRVIDFAIKNMGTNASMLSKNKIQQSLSNSDSEMYIGEYDNMTALYHGKGILIKESKNYFYEGTFKRGKKCGVGMFYKVFSSVNNIIYYRGEFQNNKFEGFGQKIIKGDTNIRFQRGTFCEGKIVQGEEQVYYLNTPYLTYSKYSGTFDENEQYSGDQCTLLKREYKVKNTTISVFTEHHYVGGFEAGKENGKGKLKQNFVAEYYSYEYEGDFKNGTKEGYGIIKYSDSFFISSYEGFFHNDNQFHMYGIVNFKSGDVYEGFFDNEFHKSYLGLYFHFDDLLGRTCDSFFGCFSNDTKNGFGRFIAPRERKSLIGCYQAGEKEGIFEFNAYPITNYTDKFLLNFGQSRSQLEQKEIEENKTKKNKIEFIKRTKVFFLMENNEIIDKAERKEQLLY